MKNRFWSIVAERDERVDSGRSSGRKVTGERGHTD